MTIIEAIHVSKVYRDGIINKNIVTALKDFSLSIQKGEIYSLLGANGAGKTTFVKILLGLTIPTSGEVNILGNHARTPFAREKIGYLPEVDILPPHLTGKMFLKSQAAFYSNHTSIINKRIEEVAGIIGLDEWMGLKIKNYSKGMKRRLLFANAILLDPEILILDEPTDGVDIEGRYTIRKMLKQFRFEGKTVLLNSHIISEVEQLSDRIGIIKNGVIVETGTVDEFVQKERTIEIKINGAFPELFLNKIHGLSATAKVSGNCIIVNDDKAGTVNRIIDEIRRLDIPIESIQKQRISIEEYFFQEYINRSEL